MDQSVQDRVDALERGFSLPRSAMAVQLHTARAGLSHVPEERHFLAADWPKPRDKMSETRFRVFRDLRRQGFYLTSAGKFGGDYLVYPGECNLPLSICNRVSLTNAYMQCVKMGGERAWPKLLFLISVLPPLL